MRIANLVSGVILILFCLTMLVLIIPTWIEEGPDGMMSPRLVPQMMIWLILGLSVLLIASNLRTVPSDDDGTSPVSREEWLAFGKIGGVFVLALALFLSFGALPASIVLIVGALLALGERRPLVMVLMPLGLIGGAWFLFYRVLGTAIM